MQTPKIYFILGIFFTLMSALLLLHPNSQALAQEQFLTYENPEIGISILYPSDWEKLANLDNFLPLPPHLKLIQAYIQQNLV